jgi:hypothetical protein
MPLSVKIAARSAPPLTSPDIWKGDRTVKISTDGLQTFLRWCDRQGITARHRMGRKATSATVGGHPVQPVSNRRTV